MDPLYDPNAVLGWAETRIEEKLNRGMLALPTGEGNVGQVADILGDWREELVTVTAGELRIYSTTIPAHDRRICLMQDPLYRNDVTHHTMGYTNRQYPMTSCDLGTK